MPSKRPPKKDLTGLTLLGDSGAVAPSKRLETFPNPGPGRPWSFRNEGKFHEAVTNEIRDDLVRGTNPRFMRLTAEFLVRGGVYTTVVAEHGKP